jgi:integrase
MTSDSKSKTPKGFHFTKKRLDNISAHLYSKQVYYADDRMRGLEICVTKAGTKSFVFRRKQDGVTRRVWLGYFPDMTIEQSRGKAAAFNSQISQGVNIFEKLATKKAELTLQNLFDEYVERRAQKTRKTWKEMIEQFDRSFEGDVKDRSRAVTLDLRKKKVSAITPKMAEQFHGDLAKKRGEYSANRSVQLLRAVFNKGKVWKLFDGENPFVGITLFPEKPRDRFLSRDEATKLLLKLETEADDTLRDFVKLSLFTGIRKSNLMALRWQDVDFNSGILTIPDTKNNTKQELALGGHEIALLAARRERLKLNGQFGMFVFPGTGATGHLTDVKKSWSTFRKNAGFAGDKHVTLHDLRRSLGAAMANANVNMALVKAALHHKDLKTTVRVYALTQQDAVRDARQQAHDAWLQVKQNDTSVKRTRRKKT